ncbi:MAG: hypothetical protein O9320_12790 [Magnetospirillum sp.]|jgi:hypothetical protein|nr:hypothetical protein [Magnetospirillum sp.]
MVALSPLTAGSPAPGFVRPTVAVQAQPSQAPSNSATGNATVAPAATPVVSISIGGGAASSAIANQVRSELINSSRALAAGGDPSAASGRPAAAVPTPPYSQNVGLYDNSTRVFVDIVLSGDSGKRVARVFGTPPPPKAKEEPVDIVA